MINTTLASVDDFYSFPVLVLFLSVVWVVVLIARFKLHPFLAMMSGAIIVGLLSGPLPDPSIEIKDFSIAE